jgi:hypothetical protein
VIEKTPSDGKDQNNSNGSDDDDDGDNLGHLYINLLFTQKKNKFTFNHTTLVQYLSSFFCLPCVYIFSLSFSLWLSEFSISLG